ncbi:MAG: hypothetical protein R6V03_07170 [Kiritimatiellia bacterium]
MHNNIVKLIYVLIALLVPAFNSYAADVAEVTNGDGASCVGHTAELHGKVVSTGGNDPRVIIYWGQKDGGTNEAQWANSVKLDSQGIGKFSKLIMGLAERTRYYYRCAAVNSAGKSWAQASTNFVISVGYSPKEVEKMEQDAEKWMLREMKKMGADEKEFVEFAETSDQMKRGVRIDTWEAWVKEYRAEILDPPVVFNVSDPAPSDVTSPINALRLQLHALVTKDVRTLHTYADAGGRREMNDRGYSVKNPDPRPWLLGAKQSPKVTVLCTAKRKWRGKEYVYVFNRRESLTSPKDGWMFFGGGVFKKVGDKYFYSTDLDYSDLVGAKGAPGVGHDMFGRYNKMYEKLKKSHLPSHFYTIK